MELNKDLASVCGLFCPACGIYRATMEDDNEKLKKIADRMKVPESEIRCTGCRTETRTAYCQQCEMRECSQERGVDFCGSCSDYPCEELNRFKKQLPHRAEIFKSLERIREAGWQQWFQEMRVHNSCAQCGTLNGWYDFSCSQCGATPGSKFVADNMRCFLPDQSN